MRFLRCELGEHRDRRHSLCVMGVTAYAWISRRASQLMRDVSWGFGLFGVVGWGVTAYAWIVHSAHSTQVDNSLKIEGLRRYRQRAGPQFKTRCQRSDLGLWIGERDNW